MLIRTPIALTQVNGPSIRYVATFDSGVRNRNRPNRIRRSSPTSQYAVAGVAVKRRTIQRDRRPIRIGKRTGSIGRG